MRTVTIVVICMLMMMYSITLADEGDEARKLYLDASALERDGKYEDAKALLEKILAEYPTEEIAIKADEKLNEILAKIEEGKLPQVPGIYIKEKSGELLQLKAKEPVYQSKGLDKSWKSLAGKNMMDYMNALNSAPYYNYILWIANNPDIPSDDIESFIVYMPDIKDIAACKLCYVVPSVGEYELAWTGDEPENTKNKTKYLVYSDWDLKANNKQFNSASLVKSTLKEGMFEIKSPQVLNFGAAVRFALTIDAVAYPFIVQPSFADMIRQQYLKPGANYSEGISKLQSKIAEKPDDLSLNETLAELYLANNNPSEALSIADKLGSITMNSDATATARISDLHNRSEFAKIILDVKQGFLGPEADIGEGLNMVEKALGLFPNSEALHLKSQLLYNNGQLSEAADNAEITVDAAKKESSPNKDYYENYRDKLICEKLTKEATENYLNTGQNLEEGIKVAKEATKKDKDSFKAYSVLAQLYQKAGKPKDAKKEAKRAFEKAENQKAPDLDFYKQMYEDYEKQADQK